MARHQAPLALHVSLTNLQGLSYPIRGVGGHDIAATTYVDWSTFDLEPGAGVAQLLEPRGRAPLDHALASAANPGAFAPRVLNRSAATTCWAGQHPGVAGWWARSCRQPAVDYASDALDAVRSADWRSVNLGRKEPGDLSLGERRSLARFALRVGRVLAGEVLGSASDRRRRRQ